MNARASVSGESNQDQVKAQRLAPLLQTAITHPVRRITVVNVWLWTAIGQSRIFVRVRWRPRTDECGRGSPQPR